MPEQMVQRAKMDCEWPPSPTLTDWLKGAAKYAENGKYYPTSAAVITHRNNNNNTRIINWNISRTTATKTIAFHFDFGSHDHDHAGNSIPSVLIHFTEYITPTDCPSCGAFNGHSSFEPFPFCYLFTARRMQWFWCFAQSHIHTQTHITFVATSIKWCVAPASIRYLALCTFLSEDWRERISFCVERRPLSGRTLFFFACVCERCVSASVRLHLERSHCRHNRNSDPSFTLCWQKWNAIRNCSPRPMNVGLFLQMYGCAVYACRHCVMCIHYMMSWHDIARASRTNFLGRSDSDVIVIEIWTVDLVVQCPLPTSSTVMSE